VRVSVRPTIAKEFSMNKNDEKKSEQAESKLSEAQKKEAWLQKNGGLVIGLGVFALLVLACLVMKIFG